MTSITLELPDELAERLAPLRAQLPRLLTLALEMMSLDNAAISDRDERLAALADAHALGDRIRAWQIENHVVDVDSVTLLNELREERDRELASLH